VIEGGKLVGIRHSSDRVRGPVVTRINSILPDGTVKECAVRIKNQKNGGVFQADVRFPNGQWAPFILDRVKGALRIRSVPEELSSTKPQPQSWE
jgi:hypothetical protein